MNSDSLDTSLIVRFITNDIPEKRKKVIELLKSNKKHKVSDLAISEAIYVLQECYHINRMESVDRLNFFLTRFSDEIEYNHNLTEVVFPFYLEHPKLSFNDCCLATYAHIEKSEPLYTFDEKLARQSNYAKILN